MVNLYVSKNRAPKHMKQNRQNWKIKVVFYKRSTKLTKLKLNWPGKNKEVIIEDLNATLLIMDITNRWKMNKEIEDL